MDCGAIFNRNYAHSLLQGRSRLRDVRMGPDGFVYLLTDEAQGALLRLEPVKP